VAGSVPPSPLRRLSRAEYLRTLEDLFSGLPLQPLDILPDPDALGFENRAELLVPRDVLLSQYQVAAERIAEAAIAKPEVIAPCGGAASADCAGGFVDGFGRRAFRRPLTASERSAFLALFQKATVPGDPKGGPRAVIEAMLQSPQFLYRIEDGVGPAQGGKVALSGYEIASRLSYALWESMPDAALFEAAGSGSLGRPEVREMQARRMLADPRARRMLVNFHRQWLEFDQIEREAEKDPKAYPRWSAALMSAVREEADRFVGWVVTEGPGTLEALLTSRSAEVDKGLAALYSVPAPASGWKSVALDPGERAGILTRASFLAGHAHHFQSSPPLRGGFVLRRMMCRSLPPPPPNADTTPPVAAAGGKPKTNRQLFEERVAVDGVCIGCHKIIDGIGFGFENYDAIGAFRKVDNGLPVNAKSELVEIDVARQFEGAVELSQLLASSGDVSNCIADKVYEYSVGRAIEQGDACLTARLRGRFRGTRGDFRDLLVAIAASPEIAERAAPQP
jgi:hypothetical protein